jgi:phosphoenolpyruvate synthase/pyruvate phosphate dikinase
VIPRTEAILRVDPQALSELLHRQVDPRAPRDRIAAGIAASPGAAVGRVVLSAADAQASLARGEPCILVRRETAPEDVRGMHAASAVVTVRGGITSHAAVVGRGLGVPCVVGCSDLEVDRRRRVLLAPGGRVIAEGDVVTVDGTTGEMLARRRSPSSTRPRRGLPHPPRLGRPAPRHRRARERRHARRRGARTPVRRRGHRALPHRAHVLRRRARGPSCAR